MSSSFSFSCSLPLAVVSSHNVWRRQYVRARVPFEAIKYHCRAWKLIQLEHTHTHTRLFNAFSFSISFSFLPSASIFLPFYYDRAFFVMMEIVMRVNEKSMRCRWWDWVVLRKNFFAVISNFNNSKKLPLKIQKCSRLQLTTMVPESVFAPHIPS